MEQQEQVGAVQVEGLRRVLALVPRPGYVVAPDGRVRAVNAAAGGAPERLDEALRRALAAAVQAPTPDSSFEVIALGTGAARLFLVVALDGSDPLNAAVELLAQRHQLTPAETDILRQWVRGCSEAEIARARGAKQSTVHIQLQRMRSKLGISRRLDIIDALRALAGLGR